MSVIYINNLDLNVGEKIRKFADKIQISEVNSEEDSLQL